MDKEKRGKIKMKKIIKISSIVAIILLLVSMTGCSSKNSNKGVNATKKLEKMTDEEFEKNAKEETIDGKKVKVYQDEDGGIVKFD